MRRFAAITIGIGMAFAGCTTEPEDSTVFTYKEKIYIPPLNREFCRMEGAIVLETRSYLYDENLPTNDEPCIYPYPEPEVWDAYVVRDMALDEYSFNPEIPGDSAQWANAFFQASGSQARSTTLVARYANNGQVTRFHYRTLQADSSRRGPQVVFYNREFGGFQIEGRTAGLEIYIIK